MSYLRSLKTPAYSNWLMVDPDGNQMCRCAKKRANWYVSRGLADIISEDPPTIKLKFQPGGPGMNDAYGLAAKQNICVVCGSEDNLTKHHIVPIMYRVFFPNEVKSRSSHDVAVICTDCHDKYEVEATKLKQQFSLEFTGRYSQVSCVDKSYREIEHISRLCTSLQHHANKIPADKRELMINKITAFLGKVPDEDDLNLMRETLRYSVKQPEPGKAIVEQVLAANKLEEFIIRWRQHFIDVAKPKHMPAHWDIHRKITRD